jgi:hypothetical protein
MAERGKFAGPSLLEMMESQLDSFVSDGADDTAVGIATAVAILRQPYAWLKVSDKRFGHIKIDAGQFNETVDGVIQASVKRVEAKSAKV